jgi:UDP-glucose 4-epimerase
MKVVITGATGNVGTSVLDALADDDAVTEVIGIARRAPALSPPKSRWVLADVARDELVPHLRGAAAVVHLAWQIQPSRDVEQLRRTNVVGTERVLRAAVDAGVRAIVHASSVGAYSPGPDGGVDEPAEALVDESWPTHGVDDSTYARHKAYCERLCDIVEAAHPAIAVVRLRPGLIFKRSAASGIRRLFLGSLFPSPLLRGGVLPVLPDPTGLRVQAVHSLDVGEAYRLALHAAVAGQARGAYNVAAEPILDARALGRILDARTVPVPPRLLRPLAAATWRLRLHPVEPGWTALALAAPLLDTTRIRTELGWAPRHAADEAVAELLEGIRSGDGLGTPPLAPDADTSRLRELRTGQGQRLS